ncbi:hypothetical protein [Brevundimonas sp.]|uniref:hypothetical protein n=1 Tax=Brevundimonas sp. TaxID=1871086 RepID=UPI00257DAA06|nr:hypothetical protein [Brevundimonas sp.]
MSFPVAVPDRRILARTCCAVPCMVYFGPDDWTAGSLLQLDLHGARLRLKQPRGEVNEEVRLVFADGEELFGRTSWRVGAVIGVQRQARNARLTRISALSLAA